MQYSKYMYRMVCLFLVFLMWQTLSLQSMAQKKAVKAQLKGKVVNTFDQPMPGVVVTVDGQDIGAVTNYDGTFTLEGIYAEDQLFTFQLIGYKTTTMPRGSNSELEVVMEVDAADQNKMIPLIRNERENYTLGAAAFTLTAKDLESTHQTNLGAALAGRVPGLFVTTGSSEPGAERYWFTVRGKTTTNSSGPLVLVDGIAAGFNSVRIEDVESVTVMKDAPATALYGMDASNGLILVKTKTGKSGQPRVRVSADYTMQESIRTPGFINSGDYASMMNEAFRNDGLSEDNMYSQSDIDHFYSGDNRDLYPNNNWYDMFKKERVASQNIFASATGGGEYVKYYTSIGFRNIESPFKTDGALEDYGRKIVDVRSNVNVKLNDMIRGHVKISSRVSRNYFANMEDGDDEIMSSLFELAPTVYGPLTPDGFVVVTTDETNPTYGRLNRSGYKKQTNMDLTTLFGLDFDLNKWVKGLSTGGEAKFYTYSNSNMLGKTNYQRWTRDLTQPDQLVFYQYGTDEKDPLTFTKNVSNNFRFEYEWSVDYARHFGDHGLHANAFVKEDYYNGDNVSEDLSVYKMTYGLQANYSYQNFLFADFVGSYVGSEQFREGDRYGFFPSADVALLLSNLEMLKDNPTLTFLKLRTSYGIVGSDNFGDMRFLYKDYFHVDGTEERYGNPDLTWEKSHKFNVGVDASFWNTLTVGIDVFNDKRTDIPVEDELIPDMSGTDEDARPMLNTGEITNKGIEMALGFRKSLNKDLEFNIGGQFAYYENKVNALGELPNPDDYLVKYNKTNHRLGQLYGYEIDYSNGNGYFNSQADIDNSGLTYEGKTPRPGDFIYKDQNGDNIIDVKDIVEMGETSNPQMEWGINGSVRFKNFDLSFLLQGLGTFGRFGNGIGFYSNYNNGTFFSTHKNAWTEERYNQGLSIDGPALTTQGSSSYKSNDYYYQDRSFWRLKNLELGYNLPSRLIKSAHMSSARIYLSGYNLLTFDRMNTEDIDVENSHVNDFPTQRYFTAGLNVTF